MKTKITSLALAVAALVIAGCSTPSMRIKHNPELFASISAADQELIKQGRVALGFTPDMVKLALGEPDQIAQKIDKTGTTVTWRYRGYDASADYGFYGYWGSPYSMRPRYWGGYYGWSGYYGTPSTINDYLRVTFRDGRVVEINQLR
ncbi:hypothetical protein M2103_001493 [Ereboglobus sp. PH5-5]|uniref:hypothetical protein n=1 Tax=unclassified Ereboglobus TaxID=2626932 RepID=UPI00240540DD|nr:MULTISPECIES: hypothetical protein [unclassified Ereboglobus]MDF9825971.1 hypothetical protein [Ereboglobus sp. PH5-10]MDF9833270.1 hypothetical protein [Ereboglobus sp. PH5-5]